MQHTKKKVQERDGTQRTEQVSSKRTDKTKKKNWNFSSRLLLFLWCWAYSILQIKIFRVLYKNMFNIICFNSIYYCPYGCVPLTTLWLYKCARKVCILTVYFFFVRFSFSKINLCVCRLQINRVVMFIFMFNGDLDMILSPNSTNGRDNQNYN